MNYKLLLQYDGTDFHGWQIQEGRRTVQGELTHALSLIEGRSVNVHGSGRTDAGVHAEGQVASVEIQREITATKLRAAINGNIGKDVRVLSCEAAQDDFHARYSALEKTYVYRIVNGPVISPFWYRYAHHDARRGRGTEGRPQKLGRAGLQACYCARSSARAALRMLRRP